MSVTDFKGAALPLAGGDVEAVAAYLGVEIAALRAVLLVEARGGGFLRDGRPVILFERHVFHRETGGRFSADYPDISNRRAGGYGKGGANQYSRLEKAIVLDRAAALRSSSWGLGQVMGFNHVSAGYERVEEFVAAMMHSEGAQLLAMASLIVTNGLQGALRARRWSRFAKGYNGPAFTKNRYHIKLRDAYRARPRAEKRIPDPIPYAKVSDLVGPTKGDLARAPVAAKPPRPKVAPPADTANPLTVLLAALAAILKNLFGARR